MKISTNSKILIWTFVLALILILVGCSLSDNDKKREPNPSTGNYVITVPYNKQSLKLDTTIEITWTVSSKIESNRVTIDLYQGDEFVQNIVNNTNATTGAYDWNVQSINGSGSGYYLKITDTVDSTLSDISYSFSIYSIYSGSYTVTSPATDNQFVMGQDGMDITWTSTCNECYSVKISLYHDGDFVQDIIKSTSDDGEHTWSNVSTLKGTSDKYTIRITSNQDQTVKGSSDEFSITSEFTGTISVSEPDESGNWEIGDNLDVTWEINGNVGTYVNIVLYQGDNEVQAITTRISSGTLTRNWSIPSTLKSADDYEIRVISESDPAIYGSSGSFTIQGIDPDEYEEDNSRENAQDVTFDTLRTHTMSPSDTDWVAIEADSGKFYLIQSTQNFYIYKTLYFDDETTAETNISYSEYSTIWQADKSGTYFLEIRPRNSTVYGDYTLLIKEWDPQSLITFVNPTSETTWAGGQSYEIQWEVDSLLFGSNVGLSLYNGTQMVMSIVRSTSNYSGMRSWNIPGGILTSDDYQLRIQSSQNSDIFALSEPFSIAGVARDNYEPNNTKDSATSIPTDGSLQNHSIYNTGQSDVDWMVFTAEASLPHIINTKSDFYFRIYIRDSADTQLAYESTTQASRIIFEAEEGEDYYINVISASSSYYGAYTISVTAHDPEDAVVFTAPDSNDTWAAGSPYTIQWEPDSSLFENNIRMYLEYKGRNIYAIGSIQANDGEESFTLPDGLASGGGYRISIVDYLEPSIQAVSPEFSIAGVPTDSYENDDSLSLAHEITPSNTAESHTFTYQDIDWYSFEATVGNVYAINVKSDIRSTIALTDAEERAIGSAVTTPVSDSIVTRAYYPATGGTYYFKITGSGNGDYHVTFQEFTEVDFPLNITDPNGGSFIAGDTTMTITWTSGIDIGGEVGIFLLDSDENLHSAIIAATPNKGSYNWTIPSTIPAGDYIIHVESRITSNIFGNSNVFSITAN